MDMQLTKGGRETKPRRSFGHRARWAVLLGLATAAGAVFFLFAAALGLVEMGMSFPGATARPPADRAALEHAVDLGRLPWMVGGFVFLVTFLKELAD